MNEKNFRFMVDPLAAKVPGLAEQDPNRPHANLCLHVQTKMAKLSKKNAAQSLDDWPVISGCT